MTAWRDLYAKIWIRDAGKHWTYYKHHYTLQDALHKDYRLETMWNEIVEPDALKTYFYFLLPYHHAAQNDAFHEHRSPSSKHTFDKQPSLRKVLVLLHTVPRYNQEVPSSWKHDAYLVCFMLASSGAMLASLVLPPARIIWLFLCE